MPWYFIRKLKVQHFFGDNAISVIVAPKMFFEKTKHRKVLQNFCCFQVNRFFLVFDLDTLLKIGNQIKIEIIRIELDY